MDTRELIDAIDRLDPDEIRSRLADLDGEQRMLRTLLRAALARKRRESQSRQREAVSP